MVDVVDKPTRSRMMAGIRAKNTKPEVALRSALHRLGFRFRIHDQSLPGRPDIVLPRYRAAVQVHGCFWHRHEGCRFATTPSSNRHFWETKFASNVQRDHTAELSLQGEGWRTAVIWECAIKERGAAEVARELSAWLTSDSDKVEIDRL